MEEKNLPEDLIRRYLDGTATPNEKAIVDSWHLQDLAESNDLPSMQEIERVHAKMRKNIISHTHRRKIITLWQRTGVAASLLLALGTTYYFSLHKSEVVQPIVKNRSLIVPGSKKAVLILANGKQINLTEAKSGTLAQQGKITVSKNANGEIVYSGNGAPLNEEIAYNTITTPRGGFYSLKLDDGTIAILDAQSSIKYPVAFTGKERLVEITGQVYFEVEHNAERPFKVKVKDQVIEDLGTIFNINAYDDEGVIRTTLVSGAVNVSNSSHSVALKPGQQAYSQAGVPMINVKRVDTEDIIAWKNGQTIFKNENIAQIMRQVSRWYNVDVVYEGDVPKIMIGGSISRNTQFTDLIKILAFDGVHFTVKDRTIYIKP